MNPLLPFALLGIGFGAADHEIHRFERAAATEIASKLSGDAKEVSVNAKPEGLSVAWGRLESATIDAHRFSIESLPFFTEPWRSKAGHIGTLNIRLHDFTLHGLRVDELSSTIPDCRYDLGLARSKRVFRISKSGEGTGWVKVDQTALADYIVKKYVEVKSATVRVFNDVVWVEGEGDFLIVKSKFEVIAKLRPVDGTRLELADAKVYFNWRRAEPGATKAILHVLNPIVDLSGELGLYDAITVTDVRLRDGYLLASGKTRIPVKPGPPNDRQ